MYPTGALSTERHDPREPTYNVAGTRAEDTLSEDTLSLAAPTSRAAAKPPRPLTSLAPLASRGAGAAPLGKRYLASRRRVDWWALRLVLWVLHASCRH
eukprot:scaffold104155_cov118-Phaeocystis_antarctica.AAC.1